MVRVWFLVAAVGGFTAVALGAFAAHGLRDRLAPRMFEIFEVAVRYQMYHALALLTVAWVASRGGGTPAQAAGWCFLAGTVLFSGSLYVLSLSGMTRLGMITPFGGVAFLAGWVLLAVAGWRTL